MAKKAVAQMNLEEAVKSYESTMKKVENFMRKWKYQERINNVYYNSLFRQLDQLATRIRFLRGDNEKHNSITLQDGRKKRSKVG